MTYTFTFTEGHTWHTEPLRPVPCGVPTCTVCTDTQPLPRKAVRHEEPVPCADVKPHKPIVTHLDLVHHAFGEAKQLDDPLYWHFLSLTGSSYTLHESELMTIEEFNAMLES